jgi:hypothetical protein
MLREILSRARGFSIYSGLAVLAAGVVMTLVFVIIRVVKGGKRVKAQ